MCLILIINCENIIYSKYTYEKLPEFPQLKQIWKLYLPTAGRSIWHKFKDTVQSILKWNLVNGYQDS